MFAEYSNTVLSTQLWLLHEVNEKSSRRTSDSCYYLNEIWYDTMILTVCSYQICSFIEGKITNQNI